MKLLSALFTSSEYSLGSIDVGDAYLMVEQEEPTVVEVEESTMSWDLHSQVKGLDQAHGSAS